MATYLPDGVGAFPQEQGFTPNYQFIMRTLDMKQSQYDQGFAQVKNIYNSILNSELLRTDNKEKRDQILSNAKIALQDLPMVDLGQNKNVSAAKSVFRPFYEDDYIANDIVKTKQWRSEIASGMSLRNSLKEEDRKRYWDVGIQDLQDWADDFQSASADDALRMQSRRYVSKPQVSEQVLKMFNEGKLNMSIDKIDGQVMYTDSNGSALQIPLTNLYMALAENDPEAMEGFSVYGRVARNRFIKENVSNGTYATKAEATKAHDQSLVNDFVKLQDQRITESSKALDLVNTKLEGWQKKLDDKTLTEDEALKMAEVKAAKIMLEQKLKEFQTNKQNASDRIMRNPLGYMSQIYLNKSASDLATALSGFGSRKISSNPLYKDFVFPKELEEFKTQQEIKLENEKSRLNMEEEKLKAQLKELSGESTGDGTTGEGKASITSLNTPLVTEDVAAAGVAKKDANNQADAYTQGVDFKKEVIRQYSNEKANFIFDVLPPDQIVGADGKPLDQNQKRLLSTNGKLLDSLYITALKKAEAIQSSDPEKYRALGLDETKERIDRKYDQWLAMDRYTTEKLTEITKYLESTQTHPEQIVKRERIVGKEARVEEYEDVTPAKNEGYYYKYLIKDGLLMSDKPQDKSQFLANVQKDKNFNEAVERKYQKEIEDASSFSIGKLFRGASGLVGNNIPTKEQVKVKMLNEIEKNYSTYRNNVIAEWNKHGYNFATQYSSVSGGGGTYAKALTFSGSSLVKGEMADKITEGLISTLPGLGGSKDFFVLPGGNKPNASADGDYDDLKESIQKGALQQALLSSIRLGKQSDTKAYSITPVMVGGSNPDYHAYTIKFEPTTYNTLVGTKDKPGPLWEHADNLREGFTVYINKDKDDNIAAKRSTLSEIDILVNTNPLGVFEKQVAPGHTLTIERHPTSGSYKIRGTFMRYSADDLNGKPESFERNVGNEDLSTLYYSLYSQLKNMNIQSQQLKTQYAKNLNNKKVFTAAEIDALAQQLTTQK